ncbi:MAG: gluconate 2-dehydrogenase subunit 3 family protein [Oceanicoccus sp.]
MNRRETLKMAAVVLGGVLSESLSAAVMAGVSPSGKVSRQLFDASGRKTLEILAELIIPETDTPGAMAAGVPDFIEVMVSDWYTDTERNVFLEGLHELSEYCEKTYGKKINDCSNDEQVSALQWSEQESKKYPVKRSSPLSRTIDEDSPFFTKIKELTVLGYYTSEVGAKQELRYNPMPMKYDGNLNFSDVGRQWSY